MKTKKRSNTTGFERFAKRFMILSIIIFIFGIITVKSLESSYNSQIQELEVEITTMDAEIDVLEMQKQELVSFTHLTDVATAKGYTYQNDSLATLYHNQVTGQVNE